MAVTRDLRVAALYTFSPQLFQVTPREQKEDMKQNDRLHEHSSG